MFAHPLFASLPGLEPGFAEPKSAVLPKLDDRDKSNPKRHARHLLRPTRGRLRRFRDAGRNRTDVRGFAVRSLSHSGTAPTRETTSHPHVSAYVSQLARQDSNLDLRIQSPPSYQLDDRRNADTKRHAFHANTRNNSMGKRYCQHHAPGSSAQGSHRPSRDVNPVNAKSRSLPLTVERRARLYATLSVDKARRLRNTKGGNIVSDTIRRHCDMRPQGTVRCG